MPSSQTYWWRSCLILASPPVSAAGLRFFSTTIRTLWNLVLSTGTTHCVHTTAGQPIPLIISLHLLMTPHRLNSEGDPSANTAEVQQLTTRSWHWTPKTTKDHVTIPLTITADYARTVSAILNSWRPSCGVSKPQLWFRRLASVFTPWGYWWRAVWMWSCSWPFIAPPQGASWCAVKPCGVPALQQTMQAIIQRVINTAQKIIGCALPSLEETPNTR